MVEVFGDEADRLASLLGDHHDLHVLHASIASDPALHAVKTIPAFVELLVGRSRRLRCEARDLGSHLHAEKPGRFVKRLASYDAATAPLT